MSIPLASKQLASELTEQYRKSRRATCAWLNHYTAQRVMHAGVRIVDLDLLPIDGQLLLFLLKRPGSQRTSADSVIPCLLDQMPSIRVGAVGGTPATREQFARAFEDRWPQHQLVMSLDGYAQLPTPHEFPRLVKTAGCDLVLIGLGAPLQETFLVELSSSFGESDRILAFTCGGWMDQFTDNGYYPPWAYPLRLTWAVRLAREPRRLWQRYTVDAVRAVKLRKDLRTFLKLHTPNI